MTRITNLVVAAAAAAALASPAAAQIIYDVGTW
jgi:hypothetical protein